MVSLPSQGVELVGLVLRGLTRLSRRNAAVTRAHFRRGDFFLSGELAPASKSRDIRSDGAHLLRGRLESRAPGAFPERELARLGLIARFSRRRRTSAGSK